MKRKVEHKCQNDKWLCERCSIFLLNSFSIFQYRALFRSFLAIVHPGVIYFTHSAFATVLVTSRLWVWNYWYKNCDHMLQWKFFDSLSSQNEKDFVMIGFQKNRILAFRWIRTEDLKLYAVAVDQKLIRGTCVGGTVPGISIFSINSSSDARNSVWININRV